MNKSLSLLAALLLSVSAWGQFNIGLKYSYSSTLSFANFKERTDNFSWKNEGKAMGNNFQVGLMMRFGERLHFQPELLYAHRVAGYDGISRSDFSYDQATRKQTLNTLDIPLLAGYSLINHNLFKLRANAGPKVSFNLGSDSEFTDAEGKRLDWAKEKFKTIALGAELGVGVDLLEHITLDVRYNLMSDLHKDSDLKGNIQTNYADPNNSFIISLGILLL